MNERLTTDELNGIIFSYRADGKVGRMATELRRLRDADAEREDESAAIIAGLTSKVAEARAAAPTWRDRPPTEPGWYWWRKSPIQTAEVNRVVSIKGLLIVSGYNDHTPDDLGGQWAGPIYPPADPKTTEARP